jgi:IrrE N-terminal-like domain
VGDNDHYRRVALLTAPEIERMAWEVRQLFGLAGHPRISMLELLETVMPDLWPGYEFQVCPDDELNGAEATVEQSRPILRMSDSSYNKLFDGDPHARFTAAHEFGHLLLHCEQTVHYARGSRIDARTDPEWQANVFAGTFLMPERMFRKMRTVGQAMAEFGVSLQAVRHRSRDLRHFLKFEKKGRRPMTRAP